MKKKKINAFSNLLGYDVKYSNEHYDYFVVPRYLRYPECYKELDKIKDTTGFVKEDLIHPLSDFKFPDVKTISQTIHKPEIGFLTKMLGCTYSTVICPLCTAIATGHLPSIRLFKETVDPFNHVEYGGWTPIHFAAANGEVAGLLELFRGTYFNDPTKDFKDCYTISYVDNLSNLDRLVSFFEICEGERYTTDPGSKKTAYKLALDNGQDEMIEFYELLKKKADHVKETKEEKKLDII